jgi:glycosyltransferase involved in cell wall biosynthesis
MSVTVFIPNRNMAGTLGAAIESACRQAPLEVVVIDDASTDGSLDVIAALAEKYEMIRLISRNEKSPCWQEAAADYYDSFSGKYVICTGADDELIDGVVSLGSVGEFPLIFTDYLVRSSPGEEPCGIITQNAAKHGARDAVFLKPDDVQERYLSSCYPTETGIGTLIRTDWLMWLRDRAFWKMGPWSDAIGYACVAGIAGAAYVPGAGAVFTQNETGYGATNRRFEVSGEFHKASRDFAYGSGMSEPAARRLLQKRGINA